MVLFTDFKEKMMEGFEFNDNIDARNMRNMRDKYLCFYQGIMFTGENLCFKSLINVFSLKDGVIYVM